MRLKRRRWYWLSLLFVLAAAWYWLKGRNEAPNRKGTPVATQKSGSTPLANGPGPAGGSPGRSATALAVTVAAVVPTGGRSSVVSMSICGLALVSVNIPLLPALRQPVIITVFASSALIFVFDFDLIVVSCALTDTASAQAAAIVQTGMTPFISSSLGSCTKVGSNAHGAPEPERAGLDLGRYSSAI